MREPDDIRQKRNASIVARMKNGQPLNYGIDATDSWWPPRPMIKKDKNAITIIFKKENNNDDN